jgi:hypothetical protein
MSDSNGSAKRFFALDDPDLWASIPDALAHLKARGGDNDVAYFLLGSSDPATEPPTVVALKMEAGRVLPRHAHNCGRFEVVVSGSLDIGERVLHPGDIMVSSPGVFYGPHVAGPDGCITFEVFSDFRGAHTSMVETADGVRTFDVGNPDEYAAYREALLTAATAPRP